MAVTYSICTNCDKINRVSLEQADGKKPVCGSCKTELPLHDGITEVTAGGLRILSQKSPLPVVADFWAPWCVPCRSFESVFKATAREMAGRAVFAKLNTEAHPLASDAYQIRSVPTLIVFQRGVERARQSGALPLTVFRNWVQSVA